MSFILWFEKIGKEDVGIVGGKGANLGEMTGAGFAVPPGFCVTARAYFEFLDQTNLKSFIQHELFNLKVEETKKLNLASKHIKKAILAAKMPSKLEEEIKKNYRELARDNDGYVAVRSSATAEDLPEASFAGAQRTFLNVKGPEKVAFSVQKCWASLFEPRAIYYRVQKNFAHAKVGIAVPIMRMIQSETSGVCFTSDPVTNDRSKIAIEAGWGLGEAVVLGAINPDRYLVSKKTGKIIEKEINAQTWKIARVGEANKHLTVAKEDQKTQKLSDQKIKELAELAKKVELHYGKPQDIEWAYEKDKIYLVQTRPITTLKTTEKEAGKVKEEEVKGKIILKGAAASLGVASGPARVIHSAKAIDQVKEKEVLVTEMTNPEFVPAMKRVVAIVTDTGGRTSHAAIVSRELGIPCVVGTGQATVKIKNDEIITVDGSAGVVYEGKVQGLKSEVKTKENIPSFKARELIPPTATKVYVNLAEKELASEVSKLPADGVGLLRAEFMIADIGEHPQAMIAAGKGKLFSEKLSECIKIFCQNFAPRPVIYRATDFKTNEYKNLKGGKKYEKDEANPMIGFRGALRYIKNPAVFNLELEAIKKVRAEGFTNLHLMIPFVRTVSEMQKIIDLVKKSGLKDDGGFKLWMMVELPSNVILIDQFCELGIEGVSIGSNDLTQLILGADRDNPALATEFDERDPAVVWALKKVIKKCIKHGVTVSICGQAPSVYPEITQVFVEAGATSVSVNPDVVISTKKLIASIEQKIVLSKVEDLEREVAEIEQAIDKQK